MYSIVILKGAKVLSVFSNTDVPVNYLLFFFIPPSFSLSSRKKKYEETLFSYLKRLPSEFHSGVIRFLFHLAGGWGRDFPNGDFKQSNEIKKKREISIRDRREKKNREASRKSIDFHVSKVSYPTTDLGDYK